MSTLQLRRWSAADFAGGREAWQALLERSDADRLFMSWDWLSRWWRHHATALRAQLQLWSVQSPAGELLGLAPFYEHGGLHAGVLRTRRLELLGNAWRHPEAVFSEYLDVIADRSAVAEVCAALAAELRAGPWDELVFCNLREGSVAGGLCGLLRGSGYGRPVETMTGWSVALPASFDELVARLASNTRRKVLHQRAKLAGSFVELRDVAAREAALKMLEGWVARRWGTAGGGARTRFHADLLASDDAVRVTELRDARGCISVMLNVRIAGTEYYLQSGFDDSRTHGLSPGYLHLGHALEAACRDGVKTFDFLAGRGLHRDYKQDFGATAVPLRSLQIVRNPSLRRLLGVADRLRGRAGID